MISSHSIIELEDLHSLFELTKKVELDFSLDQVCKTLKGNPFKSEVTDLNTVYYWKFEIINVEKEYDKYQIYHAQFDNGKLGFGHILPSG